MYQAVTHEKKTSDRDIKEEFKMKTSTIIVTTNSAAWCRDNHSLIIGITNDHGSRSVL